MGEVVGATNARGQYPTTALVTPQDVLATVCRHLEVNPGWRFTDSVGKPVPILDRGEPIRQLI